MQKEIQIGDCIWKVNYTPETAKKILDLVIEWMEQPDHYAAHSGESIHQSDNTVIDSLTLVSDIVDEALKPEFVREIE